MPSSTPITITPSSSCQFALKDYRSLPILIFYLSLAAFLSLRICTSIIYKASARQQQQQQTRDSRHVRIYILLATLSLFATWYYMFAFFASSYETWLSTRTTITATGTSCGNSSLLRLLRRIELWLRDTKLFKEAWQTVVETPARTWWSGQIFLWTTGWSLFLGVMGRRYNIPRVWMYMLLGQIVAISFAMNLFFLSVLMHGHHLPSPSSSTTSSVHASLQWLPPLWMEVLPLLVSLIGAAAVPYVAHTKHFMLVLLVPHLLLFIPAMLRPTNGNKTTRSGQDGRMKMDAYASETASATRRYTTLFKLLFTVSVSVQLKATYDVISTADDADTEILSMMKLLLNAMYDHPAVSSVSWDVVFCTVGVVTWATVHSWDLRRMLGLTTANVHEKEQ